MDFSHLGNGFVDHGLTDASCHSNTQVSEEFHFKKKSEFEIILIFAKRRMTGGDGGENTA